MLLLLSQHTVCLVGSACGSAHQAESITKPYPSPSRIHHLAVSITAAHRDTFCCISSALHTAPAAPAASAARPALPVLFLSPLPALQP